MQKSPSFYGKRNVTNVAVQMNETLLEDLCKHPVTFAKRKQPIQHPQQVFSQQKRASLRQRNSSNKYYKICTIVHHNPSWYLHPVPGVEQ